MNKIERLVIICVVALFFGSCEKSDENNANNTGVLSVDNEEYGLNHGELIKIRAVVAGEVYAGIVYLLSSDYHYGNSTITGTGQVVELTMYFNSFYNLLPGTYTLTSGEPYQAGTFFTKYYQDLSLSTMNITALYKATSGNIIVTKTNTTYALNIDILADKYNITHADTEPTGAPVATNVHITCTYKGDLIQKYLSK